MITDKSVNKRSPLQSWLKYHGRDFCIAEAQEDNLITLHEHGTADQDEEVEAVLVWKQGVPNADDVWQKKLLRQQQRQPAKSEILWFDVLLLLLRKKKKEKRNCIPAKSTIIKYCLSDAGSYYGCTCFCADTV